jgi:iron only hydrogenase large subunit-like protein
MSRTITIALIAFGDLLGIIPCQGFQVRRLIDPQSKLPLGPLRRNPSGLFAVNQLDLVRQELSQGDRVMIAQVAPAVRVSIGEELGLPLGSDCTGKMVAALRALGFSYVFDVLVGADLTILEEGTEVKFHTCTNAIIYSTLLPVFCWIHSLAPSQNQGTP